MKRYFLIPLLILLVLGVVFAGCTKPAATTAPTTTAAPTTTMAPTTAPKTTAPPTSAAPTTTAPPTSAVPKGPIKIGSVTSLTGDEAISGNIAKLGLQYGLDKSGGQVAGRQIQLITEDDASDATTGVDKARKLILSDKVDVIIGPVSGLIGFAVGNYVSSTTVPQIHIMHRDPKVLTLGPNHNMFLNIGTEEGNGYWAGLYAGQKLGYKTAIAVYEDTTARSLVDGEVIGFQKAGGSVIQSIPVTLGQMDFNAQLATLKKADCLFYFQPPAAAQRFISQYFAAGYKMPVIMGLHTVLFPPLLASIGDQAIGILGSGPYTGTIDSPMNGAFVGECITKYHTAPTAEMASAYCAFLEYLEAVKATGGDTSPAKIIPALLQVKVDTPMGVRSFTPNGIAIGDEYIMKVVKLPDRYDWEVVEKYPQIVMDVPK